MASKYCFDEQCLELARYFYPDDSDEMLNPLAQLLQQTVEDFKPRGIIRPDGTTLHASHCTLFDIEKKCTCEPAAESSQETFSGHGNATTAADRPSAITAGEAAASEGDSACPAVPAELRSVLIRPDTLAVTHICDGEEVVTGDDDGQACVATFSNRIAAENFVEMARLQGKAIYAQRRLT